MVLKLSNSRLKAIKSGESMPSGSWLSAFGKMHSMSQLQQPRLAHVLFNGERIPIRISISISTLLSGSRQRASVLRLSDIFSTKVQVRIQNSAKLPVPR
jgi:hypothetical protein